MKFFTQISNSPFQYWDSLDDVQDIPEPSHLLSDLYSMLHSQLPRNGVPNISASVEEIRFEEYAKYDLLTFSQDYSHSMMVDTRRAHEHDLYSQLPLIFGHFHYCKSELSNHEFVFEYHLAERESDILLPKLNELTFYLHYGLSFDIPPYCKTMKFIETKVAAMKLQGFNH